jgi:serine/threonine protein kinase
LDFKPENVIMMKGDNSGLRACIIDFGSVRALNTETDILCTYPYCAPEAFKIGAPPSSQCDAYSLGATIFFYIYKDYVYNITTYKRPHQIMKLFKDGGVPLPIAPPRGVSWDLFNIMIGLLNQEPDKRMTINALYSRLNCGTYENIDQAILLEPSSFSVVAEDQTRADNIDSLYAIYVEVCGGDYDKVDVFCLAVNIMDRISTKPKVAKNFIKAVYAVAQTTFYPDVVKISNKGVRNEIIGIVNSLKFELYSDTVVALLDRNYGVSMSSIDHRALVCALKGSCGATRKAAELYMHATISV